MRSNQVPNIAALIDEIFAQFMKRAVLYRGGNTKGLKEFSEALVITATQVLAISKDKKKIKGAMHVIYIYLLTCSTRI